MLAGKTGEKVVRCRIFNQNDAFADIHVFVVWQFVVRDHIELTRYVGTGNDWLTSLLAKTDNKVLVS